MNLNIENIVRSVAIAAVGLPLTLSLGNVMNTGSSIARDVAEDPQGDVIETLKESLTEDCLKYAMTKADSKLEREAKDALDETLGGEVDYKALCNWVL